MKEKKEQRAKIIENKLLWPKCLCCKKPLAKKYKLSFQKWQEQKFCSKKCKRDYAPIAIMQNKKTCKVCKKVFHRKIDTPSSNFAKRTKCYECSYKITPMSDRVIAVATAVGEPIKQGFYVFDMPKPHYSPADERSPRRL